MAMTPAEEAADRAAKIRRVNAAAATAVYAGCTADDVRAAVEAGIAQAQADLALRDAPATVEPPAPSGQPLAEPGSALETLLRAAGIDPGRAA